MTQGMQARRDRGNLYYVDDRFGAVNAMWRNYPVWMIAQDPSIAHVYFEDFHTLAIADFVVDTVSAAGTPTEVLSDAAGGYLLVTPGTNEDDGTQLQMAKEAFKLAASKPLWFEIRAAFSDATESDYLLGICDRDTTQIVAGSSGVFFGKDDGDRNIDYHCELVTVDTTGDTGVDAVAAVYNRYGIFYDGAGKVEFWIDGVKYATSESNIPTTEIMPTFGVLNGAAAAKTLTVDYIKCAQIR